LEDKASEEEGMINMIASKNPREGTEDGDFELDSAVLVTEKRGKGRPKGTTKK